MVSSAPRPSSLSSSLTLAALALAALTAVLAVAECVPHTDNGRGAALTVPPPPIPMARATTPTTPPPPTTPETTPPPPPATTTPETTPATTTPATTPPPPPPTTPETTPPPPPPPPPPTAASTEGVCGDGAVDACAFHGTCDGVACACAGGFTGARCDVCAPPAVIDACDVCGGDGSTCAPLPRAYAAADAPLTETPAPPSATEDGGGVAAADGITALTVQWALVGRLAVVALAVGVAWGVSYVAYEMVRARRRRNGVRSGA